MNWAFFINMLPYESVPLLCEIVLLASRTDPFKSVKLSPSWAPYIKVISLMLGACGLALMVAMGWRMFLEASRRMSTPAYEISAYSIRDRDSFRMIALFSIRITSAVELRNSIPRQWSKARSGRRPSHSNPITCWPSETLELTWAFFNWSKRGYARLVCYHLVETENDPASQWKLSPQSQFWHVNFTLDLKTYFRIRSIKFGNPK